MLEAKKRKVEKEEEVSRLQKEVESLSSTLESLHAKAALLTSGLDERPSPKNSCEVNPDEGVVFCSRLFSLFP